MAVWTRKIRRFLTSNDGPTAVEYAVMLALIIVLCLTAVQTIGTQSKRSFKKIGTSLKSANS